MNPQNSNPLTQTKKIITRRRTKFSCLNFEKFVCNMFLNPAVAWIINSKQQDKVIYFLNTNEYKVWYIQRSVELSIIKNDLEGRQKVAWLIIKSTTSN